MWFVTVRIGKIYIILNYVLMNIHVHTVDWHKKNKFNAFNLTISTAAEWQVSRVYREAPVGSTCILWSDFTG